ncbi:MAG: histidine phosphatase family protein [Candidatus Paceibacterota bacterium]
MKVFFVRHGQTNYNLLNLCNENPAINVHLTGLGIQQAKIVATKLKDEIFDLVIFSELPRTKETALIIAADRKVEMKTESRINDRKTGFEGKPVSDFFVELGPDVFYSKVNDGESFQEEKTRIFSFLEDLKKCDSENVLIVSHSETMQVINGYFNKLSDQEMIDTKIDNCEILKFIL